MMSGKLARTVLQDMTVSKKAEGSGIGTGADFLSEGQAP